MIIVNLKGGLGNQMFQYACGRALALKNGDTLKLDTEGLERANAVGDIYRPFSLNHFTLAAEVASDMEVHALKYPYEIISKVSRYLAFKLSRDKNTLFHPAVLQQTGDVYLDGFWQSPRYFENIRETLLKEFSLRKSLSEAGADFARRLQEGVSVSIHVRRGDYAQNPRVLQEFGLCSVEYYTKAIEKIKQRVANPTFFIFSDDLSWVKNNLKFTDEVVLVEGNLSPAVELTLMSQCRHNIIANSSFSWWGAWLNRNPDKVIISPTPWFDRAIYDQDLIPPTWIKLPK